MFLGKTLNSHSPLSTQEYKWVPANCQGNLTKCWEFTCDGLESHPGGVAILLVASCYRNRDTRRQLWATRLVKTLPTTFNYKYNVYGRCPLKGGFTFSILAEMDAYGRPGNTMQHCAQLMLCIILGVPHVYTPKIVRNIAPLHKYNRFLLYNNARNNFNVSTICNIARNGVAQTISHFCHLVIQFLTEARPSFSRLFSTFVLKEQKY